MPSNIVFDVVTNPATGLYSRVRRLYEGGQAALSTGYLVETIDRRGRPIRKMDYYTSSLNEACVVAVETIYGIVAGNTLAYRLGYPLA